MIQNYSVVGFNFNYNKWILPFIVISFLFANSINISAQNYWMQRGGGSSADEAYSISADASNNTYTTGYFTGTASFGAFNITAGGVSDIFVAKTNSSGVYQWAVKAGDGGSDRGLAITSDAAGNSYVTGYYYGTATFGINSINSAGLQDVFIVKYNSAGAVQWLATAGGSESDIGNAIAVDNGGNVIVTGQFAGTANFGIYTLTSTANNINVFTTKLNGSTGNFMWAVSGVGAHTDRGLGVACDPTGNIYITGQYTDTITFTAPHYSPLNNAIFVVKYNSAGTEQWITTAGAGASNIANAIAVDNGSNVYITGNFTGTLSFFAQSTFTLIQTYANRIFLAKYDQNGNLQWDVADGSSNPVTSNCIALDGSGNPYIIGSFYCVMNSYADQYGQGTFNTVGYWDIFNARYSSAGGAWQWSRQIGGHGNNYGNGIAVSSGANVFDAGSFDQDMIITESPANFVGYNANPGGYCTPTYCSDANYGDYAYFSSAGSLDAFIAEPIDLSRQTYDFYQRTGNSCNRPVVPICVGTSNVCLNTVQFCSGGEISIVPNSCNSISPNYTYLWSTGDQTTSIFAYNPGTYTVTQMSEDGCLSTNGSINVTLRPPPAAPTISDNVVINTNSDNPMPIRVCEKSVTLTGGNYAGNSNWYWTTPNNTSVNSTTITLGVGSDSGYYCFTVVDNLGCSNQTCVWVTIDSTLPNIIPEMICLTCKDDTAFVCKGAGFTLLPFDFLTNPTAKPSLCIPDAANHWSIKPDSANYSPITYCQNQNTFIPDNWDSGWYHITDTIIQSNVCGYRKLLVNDSIFVRIYPIPIVTLSVKGGTSLCPGDSEWIVGSGNVAFTWSNGSSRDSIYVGSGADSIMASITNNYGCTTGATATINISTFIPTVPTIIMNPSNGIICPGDSVQLICRGGPYQTFQWYGPSGPLATKDSIAYAKISGNYYCVGTDTTPCYISKLSNTVLIESYTTPFLQLPLNTNLCPGDSLLLKVVADNGAIIQWQAPLSGDSITQTIKSAGTYSVKITSCGVITICTSVITQSNPIATIKAIPSKTICTAGDSIELSALSNRTIYQWSPGNSSTQNVYIKQAGTYSLSTVDTFGCSASATIIISPPVRDSIVKAINIICSGNNTGLITLGVTGGASPYTYSWKPPQGSNATASNLSAGSYTVSVMDANGCTKTIPVTLTQPAVPLSASILSISNVKCFGDVNGIINTKILGGVGPYTYLWTPGGQTTVNATGLSPGNYTITVTDYNACTATASATITQPTLLGVTLSEPVIICKDSTGNLIANTTGGTKPYTYTWSAGVTSTTGTATLTLNSNLNFSVTVTDAGGCTATATIKLQYGPPFNVSVNGSGRFCVGDSTTICANAAKPMNGATYLWQPGNYTTPCINIHPPLTTTYTIRVIDGCGSTTTVSTTVYVNPLPIIAMTANIYEGCTPLCVQFYNATTLSQGNMHQYIWNFGNGDTLHTINPAYCYPSSGVYGVSLTVTSDSGCSATLSKEDLITVYQNPKASFTYSPQPVSILSPTIQFTNKSTDAYGIVYWLWSFGDTSDSSSTLKNPSHTYHDTGSYCANLVVMNSHGCTDTTINCLIIEPDYNLYIPSAFTPNGDGINDIFKPQGQYVRNFEMYIFDRWGMQLFHTTDANEGWNGTIHGVGSICQEDTYVYKITVTDTQGNPHSYVGNITLIK